MEYAIRTTDLTKRYGRTLALDGVAVDVPEGVVFGYLGPNGAGKTTTIRLLMGSLRPSAGHATVLGLDAVRDRDAVHRRVGYLPGEFYAYPDLTGEQYLRYLGHLRGSVEWTDVEVLAKRLDIDLQERIASLSHGNRQKVGLIQAFMHRPELLVLDEPTIGLDPLMQHEFVSMVREARDAGAAVFLSSHLLDEVEAVADVIGIVRAGRLVAVENVDDLKTKAHRRVTFTFVGDVPVDKLRMVPSVRELRVDGPTAQLAIEGSMDELLKVAAPFGVRNIVSHEVDLEEIFLAYYNKET